MRRWWWLPLVMLGALLITAALVGSWVSGIARDEAAAAAGIGVDRVEVNGLDITLTGFTDEGERDRAVAAVAALESSEKVIGLMARSADARSVDEETVTPSSSSTAEPGAVATTGGDTEGGDDGNEAEDGERAGEVAIPGLPTASINLIAEGGGAVTLEGVVSSEQARSDVLALAEIHFGQGSVTDSLSVDEEAVGPTGGTLVVVGEAGSDEQRAEILALATSLAKGLGYEVSDELEVISVADALNELFALDPIEFDARKATLRPSARATLDEAAALIDDRPDGGNLLVVGHTDSDGRASRNLDLSQRRAQAVIDYLVEEGGVDSTRLEAKGLGEEQLLVSPELTANDKQRNRRIEWELAP